MNEWSNFFVAIAGASAALTGLIFVGVSISLTRILALPQLPGRAAQSLILLITTLIISILCLVPSQSSSSLGTELLIVSVAAWIVAFRLDLDILRKTDAQYKNKSVQNIIFTQLAVLPYIIGGIMTLKGFGGVYWLIPAIIFSFIKAVVDAWVLLLEIHR